MDNKQTYIIIGVVVLILLVVIVLATRKEKKTTTTLSSSDMSNYAIAVKSGDRMNAPSQLLKTVPLSGYNNLVLSDPNGNLNSMQFPAGIVVIWTGSADNIPAGWALCDGTVVNGFQTPDLRSKFLLGIDKASNNQAYRTIGGTGGEEKVALDITEMPKHNHDLERNFFYDDNAGSGPAFSTGGYDFRTASNKTRETGGDTSTPIGKGVPHNNMPPFYTVAYIVKLP